MCTCSARLRIEIVKGGVLCKSWRHTLNGETFEIAMTSDTSCGNGDGIPKPYVYEATIDLLDGRYAQIVASALSVDDELRPAQVARTVSAIGTLLHIHVAACDARSLRTSALSILDFAVVSVRALEAFAPQLLTKL
jgi:tRNA threonylcarbamoyladenosine modification (KEOPS) complex  Pcc1 subunit